MALIRKIDKTKCSEDCGETGTLTHWAGMKNGAGALENSLAVPQKADNTELSSD